jgi:pyruvate,water dikinase
MKVPVGSSSISGLPASPGVAEGRVRILRTETDLGQLQNGDVGMFYYYSPHMLPAFKKCCGVIGVEGTGGMTGHLAIIARELGLPAVVGITSIDASHLGNRRNVVVDGKSGRIHVTK